MSTQHSRSNHTVSAPKAVNAHQNRNNGGVNKTIVSHQGNGTRKVASKTVTSHETAARGSVTTKNEHTRLSKSEVRNVSPGLKQGASSNTRASLYQKNKNQRNTTRRKSDEVGNSRNNRVQPLVKGDIRPQHDEPASHADKQPAAGLRMEPCFQPVLTRSADIGIIATVIGGVVTFGEPGPIVPG